VAAPSGASLDVMSYPVEASRFVRGVTAQHAFDALIAAPLPQLFDRRALAISAVGEVRGQEGDWGSVGQTRTIVLADGGTLRETLTSVDRPRSFGYVLDQVTGPLKILAHHVDGTWSVDPDRDGVRVGWEWDLHPTMPGRVLMPVFGWMWRRYAALALERVETALRA
jgi:hypothetical protein